MNVNKYQQLAIKTANKLSREDLLVNGALGLAGEGGEVADIVKKWKFQGHKLDTNKIINELGDVCWYIAIMSYSLGIPLEMVLQENIDKLQKRYPEGFDSDRSVNRQD